MSNDTKAGTLHNLFNPLHACCHDNLSTVICIYVYTTEEQLPFLRDFLERILKRILTNLG